jgi:hypothetical protein
VTAADVQPGAETPRAALDPRPARPAPLTATDVVPLVLVVFGEAAWISVIGGLFQEFTLRDTILGLPVMAVFVAAGVVIARVAGPRLGDRWPVVAFVLVIVASIIGLLASPEARGALLSGPAATVATHPGGLLAGLALLRGFAHARLPLAEDTVANLFAIGLPGIAAAAAVGGAIGEPIRSRFLEATFVAAVVFVGSAVLALAIARIDAMGLDSGFDWRRNPSWLLLAIVLIAAALTLALPLAAMAGTLLSIGVSVALWPLLALGLVSGFDQVIRRVFLFFLAVVGVLIVIVRLFGREGVPPPPPDDATITPAQSASTFDQLASMGIGGLLLFVVVVGSLILIALWMRRVRPTTDVIGETRVIDATPEGTPARRRRILFRRRPTPTNAVEAYVALVDELDRHDHVRRVASETPASHAARLRAGGHDALGLDLLAADYALARYGGATLTEREDQRAIGRWRILRRRLRDWGGRRGGTATAPDREVPVDVEPRRAQSA